MRVNIRAVMKRYLKHILTICAFTLLATVCAVPSAFAGQGADEYRVKAAFIYKFMNFVEWSPQSSVENSPTITLCIVGDDPFGSALSDLQDETVRGKRLTIRHRFSDDLRGCNIIFLPTSEKHHAAKILRNIGNSDVLTVSDTAEGARQGIIISFFVEQKKVRFAVNIDAARREGLKISAKLLKLAKIVADADSKDDTE